MAYPKIDTIAWHEENLKNMILSLKERTDTLIRLSNQADSLSKDIHFLSKQIQEAKNRGKEKFDRDRFLKKRGK